MDELNELATKTFAILKGNNLKVKIFDDTGTETYNPNAGRRFFVSDPNIMVTINPDSGIELSKGVTVKNISTLQKNLRRLADEFLINLDIKVFGKQIQPRDYAYQVKMEKGDIMMENEKINVNSYLMGKILHFMQNGGELSADEICYSIPGTNMVDVQKSLNKLVKDKKLVANSIGNGILYSVAMDEAITESFSKMFGSKTTSKQMIENVKIIIRHKNPVNENMRGARTRHISAIFLECNGERIRFPYNSISGARAMAQHLSRGGNMVDQVGTYISESTGQLLKLQEFNKYAASNKLINENNNDIIKVVTENITNLKTELKKLTTSRTYESVKSRIETYKKQELNEGNVDVLRELFTIRKFDEKFNEVLPIVNQLVSEKLNYLKRIEEAAGNTVYISNMPTVTTIFEYSNEYSKISYKISELASKIIGNDELTEFVNNVSNKICKEGKIDDFEKTILFQVFKNTKVKSNEDKPEELKECIDLERHFSKFNFTFLK